MKENEKERELLKTLCQTFINDQVDVLQSLVSGLL